jgi:hypothetical protein
LYKDHAKELLHPCFLTDKHKNPTPGAATFFFSHLNLLLRFLSVISNLLLAFPTFKMFSFNFLKSAQKIQQEDSFRNRQHKNLALSRTPWTDSFSTMAKAAI